LILANFIQIVERHIQTKSKFQHVRTFNFKFAKKIDHLEFRGMPYQTMIRF